MKSETLQAEVSLLSLSDRFPATADVHAAMTQNCSGYRAFTARCIGRTAKEKRVEQTEGSGNQ